MNLKDKITEWVNKLEKETDAALFSDEILNYLNFATQFHCYSFGNIILIMCQKPEATRVAGYNKWKQLGFQVRSGEKGIAIAAPQFRKLEEGEEDNGNRKAVYFKTVYVFDISQVGIVCKSCSCMNANDATICRECRNDLPVTVPQVDWYVQGDDDAAEQIIALLTEFANDNCIIVEVKNTGRARGMSMGGTIFLHPDQSPLERVSVMVHELAHELLHKSSEKGLDKKIKETEAEATSYVVMQWLGVDTPAPNYLALHGSSASLLQECIVRITETAKQIIECLSGECEKE